MLTSQDYICIFEEENVIVGVIIPDGYRQVYGEILDESRKEKHAIMGFFRKMMMEPHTKEVEDFFQIIQ